MVVNRDKLHTGGVSPKASRRTLDRRIDIRTSIAAAARMNGIPRSSACSRSQPRICSIFSGFSHSSSPHTSICLACALHRQFAVEVIPNLASIFFSSVPGPIFATIAAGCCGTPSARHRWVTVLRHRTCHPHVHDATPSTQGRLILITSSRVRKCNQYQRHCHHRRLPRHFPNHLNQNPNNPHNRQRQKWS